MAVGLAFLFITAAAVVGVLYSKQQRETDVANEEGWCWTMIASAAIFIVCGAISIYNILLSIASWFG